MKTKFILLAIVLLLISVFPAAAQDHIDSEPIGSVWESEQRTFPAANDSMLVMPAQIGLGGTAEAIAGMTWYGIPYNIVGTAISKIISGSNTYNVCAQVIKVERDGVNKGGSGRVCGAIGVGGSKQADHRVWEDWHGSYWVTQSWHEFSRYGEYWAPILAVSQNL